MIRGSLDPSSAHGFMLVSAAKGLAFQRRTVAGGPSVSTASEMVTAPRWVRLDRVGNTITTYQSADGTSWLRVGTENIALAPSIHVGLAVSSHTTAATATALFDNVSVTSLATEGGACPSVVLSSPSFYSGAGEANWIISVTAPSTTCAWTALSDSPWLIVKTTVPTPPVGSGSVKVRALANTSGSKRVGHFIIGGVTYTVTQEF
jgi:hypothetical protein